MTNAAGRLVACDLHGDLRNDGGQGEARPLVGEALGPDAAEVHAAAVRQGGRVERCVDGRRYRAEPLAVPEGATLWLVTRDRDLTDAELRLRATLDGSEVATWVWDLRADLVWGDHNLARLFELPALASDSVPVESLLDRIHPDDRNQVRAQIEAAVALGHAYEAEFRVLEGSDDEVRWIAARGTVERDAEGVPVRFPGFVLDITERKRVEVEAERARDRLERITQAMPSILAVYDLVGEQNVFANRELFSQLGYLPGELSTMGGGLMGELVHPDDARSVRAFFDAFQDLDDDEIRATRYRVRHRDGSWRWLDMRATPFRFDDAGRVRQVVIVANDVSDTVRAESELREAKQQAEGANQAKSEFLANMSHEIRTPMTAILGFTNLLLRDSPTPEVHEWASGIRRNGEHLLRIINDILDLSQVESGQLSFETCTFSPVELVTEVASAMQGRAQDKGLTLEVTFWGLLPAQVESDPTRLRQVLINLIGNAIKFTEEGGVMLRVSYDAESERLRFAIEDTGIGIAEARRQQIFEPFYQADSSGSRAYGGTGLGLTISRRLVRALGGELTVDSVPGAGSAFAFDIAASTWGPHGLDEFSEPEICLAPAHLPEVASEALIGVRVLVVDDHEDVRRLVAGQLAAAGATIMQAAGGAQALERTMKERIDVVLLDMQMPGIDGFETAKKLRQRGFTGRVVALTASAMAGDRERCLGAGCDAYLSKPVSTEELIDAVTTAATEITDVLRPELCGPLGDILLVEDNIDAGKLTARALEHMGFEVRHAATGAEAERMAREAAPAAVLLDLGLPDLDGFEVLRRLRELDDLEATLFVALTGRVDAKTRARCEEAGFHHHLAKPVHPEQLESVLAG